MKNRFLFPAIISNKPLQQLSEACEDGSAANVLGVGHRLLISHKRLCHLHLLLDRVPCFHDELVATGVEDYFKRDWRRPQPDGAYRRGAIHCLMDWRRMQGI